MFYLFNFLISRVGWCIKWYSHHWKYFVYSSQTLFWIFIQKQRNWDVHDLISAAFSQDLKTNWIYIQFCVNFETRYSYVGCKHIWQKGFPGDIESNMFLAQGRLVVKFSLVYLCWGADRYDFLSLHGLLRFIKFCYNKVINENSEANCQCYVQWNQIC